MLEWLFTRGEREQLQRLEQKCALLKLRVEELSTKLHTATGTVLAVRLNELEAELVALQKSNRRELGRLWKLVGSQEIEIAPPPRASASSAFVCDNWMIAQREGPHSEAARCDCAYCVLKRTEREAVRAQLIPKTTAERKNAIEKGKH